MRDDQLVASRSFGSVKHFLELFKRHLEVPEPAYSLTKLAVTVHNGAISELDQTYGALGTFVAEREIGVQGPIREHYVVSSNEPNAEPVHYTEVCWPVFHTKGPELDDDEPHATPST